MARVAVAFSERRMGRFKFLISRFSVAREAQIAAFDVEKILVLGGVGGMAGQTPLVADHRGMIKGYPLADLLVTVQTESVRLLKLELRIL